MLFFNFFKVLTFENSLIFQIEQFRIIVNFFNRSIIAIWKIVSFPNYVEVLGIF